MKKQRGVRRLALLMALVLLLVIQPLGVLPAGAAGANRTIGRLATAPTVDGVIAEGEWGPKDMDLNNYQTFTVPGSAEKVALSGEVYLGYDATHFYLAVVAVYEDHQNDHTGYDVWRGDALQIQISADGKNDRRAFSFGVSADGKVKGYQSGRETYEIPAPGGEFFVKRNEATNTTVYEIALPLSRFSGDVKSFAEGDEIAFSYAMHMHNGYYYEWCRGIVKEKNIATAAILTLGEEKEMAPPKGETLLMGDVDKDGVLTSTDARLTMQYAAKKVTEADLDLRVADVDGDKSYTTTDARMMLQYAVDKIDAFPAGDVLELPAPGAPTKATSSNSFSPMSDAAGTPFASLEELEENLTDEGVVSDRGAFGYFAFTTECNEGLPFNVACYITEDTITAMLPAGADLTALIPTFRYFGQRVEMNGQPVASDATVLDLSEDVVLTLVAPDGENSRELTVHIETLDTGLPSVAMTVDGYGTIASKTEYVDVSIYVGGGEMTGSTLLPATAKGRGNTSWGEPKKGYTVKLNENASLLGMSDSNDWALVANYEDKSLLRNVMAEYLAEGADLDYVVQNRPVDLWYNGEYWGTYNLVEKIEIEKDRVNITKYEPGKKAGEVGFLMEFDGHVVEIPDWQRNQWQRPLGWDCELYYDPVTDEVFMPINVGGKWLTIKKPSYENLQNDKEQLRYIYNKVNEAVEALYTEDYKIFSQFIDVESFSKWYLVEEYMNNGDSSFHSSCYMTLDVNGKFKLGPVWDFDRSSENCHYWNPEERIDSLYTAGSAWFYLIYKAPEAREILKAEYKKFRVALEGVNAHLETMADSIYASQQYNFEKWDILEHVVDDPGGFGNNVTQAQRESQTFEAEIARLEAFFNRQTAKMDAFMASI
ncbi:MAG: CotH kinase family protein [Clostridia bacterium]|nr:CotH kinase family protein [Clostridia bacterium]